MNISRYMNGILMGYERDIRGFYPVTASGKNAVFIRLTRFRYIEKNRRVAYKALSVMKHGWLGKF